MTSTTVPGAFFTDALAGPDGTGDPVLVSWVSDPFPDPLAAAMSDPAADLYLAGAGRPWAAPVAPAALPPLAAAPEDWTRDLRKTRRAGAAAPTPTGRQRRSTAASSAPSQLPPPRAAPALRPAPATGRRPAVGPGPTATTPGQISVYRPAAAAPLPYQQVSAAALPYQQAAAPPSYRQMAAQPARYTPSVPAASSTGPAQAPFAARFPAATQRPMARASGSLPTTAEQRQARRAAAGHGAPAKKSGGLWGLLVFLLIMLFASGVGSKILDALSELFKK